MPLTREKRTDKFGGINAVLEERKRVLLDALLEEAVTEAHLTLIGKRRSVRPR